jgi:hypothetical protein
MRALRRKDVFGPRTVCAIFGLRGTPVKSKRCFGGAQGT